jgi:D-aminoacyl-tRNA deacylase
LRVLLQRVTKGRVTVGGRITGEIGPGLVVLLGVGQGDGRAEADFLAAKIANLRIFSDTEGKFNLSALDTGAAMLVVSQFTLFADIKKGRRPSFTNAADPALAAELIEYFVGQVSQLGLRVETGEFQAHMVVEIQNDGPVTIWMDTAELMR